MTLPAMSIDLTLYGSVEHSFFCVCVLAVCVLGVALPFLVPRTPQVLIPLMAALMIHETMMLAIGVMTHNHDPGDQGCRSSCCSCIVQGLCTLQHMHCTVPPVHAVRVHTILLLFSNGCNHDPRDHDAGHLV